MMDGLCPLGRDQTRMTSLARRTGRKTEGPDAAGWGALFVTNERPRCG